MNTAENILSPSSDKGSLGIMHLKRYWEKCIAQKNRRLVQNEGQDEWNWDITLLAALGLGLEQTIKFVYHSSSGFDDFERWILEVNGGKLVQEKIDSFNASITRVTANLSAVTENMLTAVDMDRRNENVFIIIREAISKQDCEDTINLICDYINIKRNDPATWYHDHPGKQGIMVQRRHQTMYRSRYVSY